MIKLDRSGGKHRIDVCATLENTIIAGEAKWIEHVSRDDIQSFINKLRIIKQKLNKESVKGLFLSKEPLKESLLKNLPDYVHAIDLNMLPKFLDEIYQKYSREILALVICEIK